MYSIITSSAIVLAFFIPNSAAITYDCRGVASGSNTWGMTFSPGWFDFTITPSDTIQFVWESGGPLNLQNATGNVTCTYPTWKNLTSPVTAPYTLIWTPPSIGMFTFREQGQCVDTVPRSMYFVVNVATAAPTLQPTTVHPSKSPSSSMPSRSPSHSPSRAPSRSPSRTPSLSPTHKPTTSKPSKAPTSSLPSHSPSRSPSHTPTRSPSRSPSHTPTRSPTRPTHSPSSSPSRTPTSSLPTKTPTSSAPTTSPSFICPPGSFSAGGYQRDGRYNCTLCPSGNYELSTDTDHTSCTLNPCLQIGYWCGPGSVDYGAATSTQHNGYRRVITYAPFALPVVFKSSRIATVNLVNTDPTRPIFIQNAYDILNQGIVMISNGNEKMMRLITSASINNTNVSMLGSQGFRLGPGSQSVPLTFVLDTSVLGSDIASASLIMQFAWRFVDETVSFQLQVQGALSVVSVIVSPNTFTYNAYSGTKTSAVQLSPVPQIDVYNTLCGFDIEHSVVLSCGDIPTASWVTFNTLLQSPQILATQNRTITQKRGTQDIYEFDIDFTNVGLDGVNATTLAAVHQSCFTVQVFLLGLDTMLSNPITVTAVSVEDCRPGYYAVSGMNDKGCSPCPVGSYSDVTAGRACASCPDSVPLTKHVGSTTLGDCLARAGYVAMNGIRYACPFEMICTQDATTVQEVQLLPGYWRTRPDSLQIFPCPSPQFCVGGTTFRANWTEAITTASDELGVNSSGLCAPYHTGVFCEACIPDYTHRGTQRFCQKCSSLALAADQGQVAGIMIGFIALFFVLLGIFIYTFHFEKLAKSFTGRALRAHVFFKSITNDAGVKAKILISEIQVLSGMSISFSPFLPQPFFDQLGAIFNILAFDLIKIVDFGCTLPVQNHYTGLLISTIVPLFVMMLIGVSHLAFQKWLVRKNYLQFKHEAKEIFSTVLFLLLFLIYPAVSQKILKTFSCDTFDAGTIYAFSTLTVDRTLVCDFPPTDEYLGFFIYAVIIGVFYILGIPLLFFVLLYRKRKYLNPPGVDLKLAYAMREMDRHVQAYRFLWRPYAPQFFWVESLELWRKLAQGAVLIFTTQGTTWQVISQLGVTVASVIFLQSYRPYAAAANNLLAIAAQWCIFAISFIVLLESFKLKAGLVGCGNREASYDTQMLNTLMILSVLFVPVLAALQLSMSFASVLYVEAKRALCECIFGREYIRQRTKKLQKQMTRMLSVLEADVVSDKWRDNRDLREKFNRLTEFTLLVKDGGFGNVEDTLMRKILEHNGTIQDSHVRQLDRLESSLQELKQKLAEVTRERDNLEDDVRESEIDRLHDEQMMDTWQELTAGNDRLIIEIMKEERTGFMNVLRGIALYRQPSVDEDKVVATLTTAQAWKCSNCLHDNTSTAKECESCHGETAPWISNGKPAQPPTTTSSIFARAASRLGKMGGSSLLRSASNVFGGGGGGGGSPTEPTDWSCPKCTFNNPSTALSCGGCNDEIAPWLRTSNIAVHPIAALFKALGAGFKTGRSVVVEEAEGTVVPVPRKRKSTFGKQLSLDLESSSVLPVGHVNF